MITRTPIPDRVRFRVLKRDDFTCHYCGRSRAQFPDLVLHVDHVFPVALGGTNNPANLVTACQDCNLGKGAEPLDGAARVAHVPVVIRFLEVVLIGVFVLFGVRVVQALAVGDYATAGVVATIGASILIAYERGQPFA